MKRVRMLVALTILGELRQVGDELELVDDVADYLTRGGRCETLPSGTKEKKKPKAEHDGPPV